MFESHFDLDRMIRHTATATVTAESLSQAFLGWFEHPDFDPDLPVLWDVRYQLVALSFEELAQLHKKTIDQTSRRRRAGGRTAVLVSELIADAAAREIIRNGRFRASYRIFMREPAAISWLGAAPPVEAMVYSLPGGRTQTSDRS